MSRVSGLSLRWGHALIMNSWEGWMNDSYNLHNTVSSHDNVGKTIFTAFVSHLCRWGHVSALPVGNEHHLASDRLKIAVICHTRRISHVSSVSKGQPRIVSFPSTRFGPCEVRGQNHNITDIFFPDGAKDSQRPLMNLWPHCRHGQRASTPPLLSQAFWWGLNSLSIRWQLAVVVHVVNFTTMKSHPGPLG